MKVAIITFIRAYNHGAVLQSYALQKKLNDMNIDAEVIDYYPKYFKDEYNLSYLGELRFFPYRPIRNWLKYTPMLWILKKRIKGFEKFIFKNIKLTEKQYLSYDEIDNEVFECDAFITGSDQVWHDIIGRFDPVYFLDFKDAGNKRKLSYAASFGFDRIPKELKEEYSRRLKEFERYSVREKSGQDIIYELLSKEATQCCDPTLLLNREEWELLCSDKVEKQPYILVYYVKSDREILSLAKALADKKHMKVISITSVSRYENIIGENAKKYNIKHRGACAPDEFLTLFANAKYVLTDSFHGTVFSLIFHRKFMTITEFNTGAKNHRATDLLKLVGAPERQFNNNLNVIENDLCWNDIDTRLKVYRQSSIDYLKSFDCILNKT